MSAVIRIADAKGRVILPGFANATVIVEACSPNEYRIRKAEVIPADEAILTEDQMPVRLSKRDAGSVLKSLEKPPRPNAAARRAAKRFKEKYG
jgi:hypothetical protein